MTEWANIPDVVFKDMINHHDYNFSNNCPKSDMWTCPTKNDFKATKKVDLFDVGKGKTGLRQMERYRDCFALFF